MSSVVQRDQPGGMNIALILLGLGLLPESQGIAGQQDGTQALVPRMADLSVMSDSTGARGDDDGGGGGGGIVDWTSHRRSNDHRPSDKSPPSPPSPTTLAFSLPPTPPLSSTVPFVHQSAMDHKTKFNIKWCPFNGRLSQRLRVGRIIGAGRLWKVYEGLLSWVVEHGSALDEGDKAASLTLDLDHLVWSAPLLPDRRSGASRHSESAARSHSSPIPTTSSIPVAVKIFDPSVHLGADLAELHRSASTEVDMYAGPLAQARADGHPLAPACHAVWEWDRVMDRVATAPVAAKGIIMVMDRVRPVFRGALRRGWSLSSLCDRDR